MQNIIFPQDKDPKEKELKGNPAPTPHNIETSEMKWLHLKYLV